VGLRRGRESTGPSASGEQAENALLQAAERWILRACLVSLCNPAAFNLGGVLCLIYRTFAIVTPRFLDFCYSFSEIWSSSFILVTSRWTRGRPLSSANTLVEVSPYTSHPFLRLFLIFTIYLVSTSHQKVVLEIDFSGCLWVFHSSQRPYLSVSNIPIVRVIPRSP
jgi:hypothetical protein